MVTFISGKRNTITTQIHAHYFMIDERYRVQGHDAYCFSNSYLLRRS